MPDTRLLPRLREVYINHYRFYSHTSPDVDSLLSLVIIFWILRDALNITLEEFANHVELVSADSDIKAPYLGIDIGFGVTANNIKRSEMPIVLDGNNISPVCCSLYLAYNLLPRRQFDAIKPLLLQINDVDTRGINSLRENNSDDDAPVTINLWSIIGVLQQNNSLLNTLMIAENIFSSYLETAIKDMDSVSLNLNATRVVDHRIYRIAIPPINSGRAVGQRCFKTLRASAVIFSTYNPTNSMATLGVSVSKNISMSGNLINLQDIVKYEELEEFATRYNLYTSPHVVGRTDKSPFLVNTEKLEQYRIDFERAMIRFFDDYDKGLVENAKR